MNPKNVYTLNAYIYARNNPMSYIDPTGMFFEWVSDESWKTIANAVNEFKIEAAAPPPPFTEGGYQPAPGEPGFIGPLRSEEGFVGPPAPGADVINPSGKWKSVGTSPYGSTGAFVAGKFVMNNIVIRPESNPNKRYIIHLEGKLKGGGVYLSAGPGELEISNAFTKEDVLKSFQKGLSIVVAHNFPIIKTGNLNVTVHDTFFGFAVGVYSYKIKVTGFKKLE